MKRNLCNSLIEIEQLKCTLFTYRRTASITEVNWWIQKTSWKCHRLAESVSDWLTAGVCIDNFRCLKNVLHLFAIASITENTFKLLIKFSTINWKQNKNKKWISPFTYVVLKFMSWKPVEEYTRALESVSEQKS